MFDDLSRKLKNLALIVFILELAAAVILTLLLLSAGASFLSFLEVWIVLPLSACISAFPLYGLGEVMESQESVRQRVGDLETNLNKMKTEELHQIRFLLERIAPKAEEPSREPEKPAAKPAPKPAPKPAAKPVPEPKKTVPEALQYALQFSTDEGMRTYLNGFAVSLSQNERPALDAVLDGDPELLRQRVKDWLARN